MDTAYIIWASVIALISIPSIAVLCFAKAGFGINIIGKGDVVTRILDPRRDWTILGFAWVGLNGRVIMTIPFRQKYTVEFDEIGIDETFPAPSGGQTALTGDPDIAIKGKFVYDLCVKDGADPIQLKKLAETIVVSGVSLETQASKLLKEILTRYAANKSFKHMKASPADTFASTPDPNELLANEGYGTLAIKAVRLDGGVDYSTKSKDYQEALEAALQAQADKQAAITEAEAEAEAVKLAAKAEAKAIKVKGKQELAILKQRLKMVAKRGGEKAVQHGELPADLTTLVEGNSGADTGTRVNVGPDVNCQP